MSETLEEMIQNAIDEAISDFEKENEIPRFLVLGATGAGKSSLLNRVYRAELHPVRDIASTTRTFSTKEYSAPDGVSTRITDSPGYGEVGSDEEYSRMVVEESRNCHVIILVLKADEKGYQRDQDILSAVFKNHEFDQGKPLIIALNQIDKLPPIREWEPPYRLAQVQQLAEF